MASSRSRFVSVSYKVDDEQQQIRTDLGERNATFLNDDIDLEPVETPEFSMSRLHVDFSGLPSTTTTNDNYQPDSTLSTEPIIADETEVGSDDEVAAHVSNTDDPTTLVLTFRSWSLGLLFTMLLSFVNQFFWYRTSPLFVGTLVAQLLTYPLGRAMAKFLPERKFRIVRWTFSLNPGPFTIKEHCIITSMANATCVTIHDALFLLLCVSFVFFLRAQPMPST